MSDLLKELLNSVLGGSGEVIGDVEIVGVGPSDVSLSKLKMTKRQANFIKLVHTMGDHVFWCMCQGVEAVEGVPESWILKFHHASSDDIKINVLLTNDVEPVDLLLYDAKVNWTNYVGLEALGQMFRAGNEAAKKTELELIGKDMEGIKVSEELRAKFEKVKSQLEGLEDVAKS